MPKRKIQNDDLDQVLSLDSITLGDLGTYMLFEEIQPESIRDACEFIIKANYVYKSNEPVTLMINSPGGDVYDGFALIDLMQSSRIKVQTVAVGLVASMGALIFTAGAKGNRVMARNSYMMLHQFHQHMDGKYHELIAHRSHEDRLHAKFIDHFVQNSNLGKEEVQRLLLNAADTYIEPKDALRMGLCDIIQDPWEV